MMFVKQIDMKEAFRLMNSGVEVNVLVPMDSEGSWSGMEPTTLQEMLNGVLFFRREPAMENPEFDPELLKQDPKEPEKESPPPRNTDEHTPEPSGSTKGETSKRAGSGAKRKQVDTGKLLALRKAGWSMKKIGDELWISEGSVFNYLKKMEENHETVNALQE